MSAQGFGAGTSRPCCQNRAASRLGQHQHGKLLRLIADSGKFDVFLTMDKNLPLQNKIRELPFIIVILRAKSNRLENVFPFAPLLLRRLAGFQPGHVYVLTPPD